jgi:hypothetical protein
MGKFQESGVSELEVLRRALDGLRGDLPKSWLWRMTQPKRADTGFDAVVALAAPDGRRVELLVQVKRLIRSRDLSALVDQIRSRAAEVPGGVPLLVARYLSPPLRERLEREGIAYADVTGNRRLALESPALFIRNVGETSDPWRGPGRPRGTLTGTPAARVVRFLTDFAPPYTVPQVTKGSGASTGATYRVIAFLEEEGLIKRERGGLISDVRWRLLLERWSRDYQFQANPTEPLLFPRGLELLVETLREAGDLEYVLTGALAARRLASHAVPRLAMLYVNDMEETVERLGLRRVDTGANVLVARDRAGVGFLRAQLQDGLRVAAPSQVAVDLLTGPGRSPSEGEALLDWMEAHEREWRT